MRASTDAIKDPTVQITLSMRRSLSEKVRKLQTETIIRTGANYSYSKAVSDILEDYFNDK
jgi:hypothetical protein